MAYHRNVIFTYLLLIVSLICASCGGEDIEVQFVDDQPDSEIVYHRCGNGSNDGNPAQLTVAFDTQSLTEADDSAIHWEAVDLSVEGLFLSEAELCDSDIGAWLPSQGGKITVNMLGTKDLRLAFGAPADTAFCSLDIRLNWSSGFSARGLTPDGRRVSIETTLYNVLPLVADTGTMQWQKEERSDLLISLDLDRLITAELFEKIEASGTEGYVVDSEHNEWLLTEVNNAILKAFSLHIDKNSDGMLSPQDESIGRGDPDRAAGYRDLPEDSDGDEDGDIDYSETDGDGCDGCPEIIVSPESVEFGIVPLGNYKTRSLTISNSGCETLEINNLSIAGQEPVEFTIAEMVDVPTSVQPGDSFDLEMLYAPVDAGMDEAILSILSNACDAPLIEVPLQGGHRPHGIIEVTPTEHDFGNVSIGNTGEFRLQIYNDAEFDENDILTVDSIIFEGVSADSFFIEFDNEIPLMLPPQNGWETSVYFQPQTSGQHTARIVIEHDAFENPYSEDPFEPVVVELSGSSGKNCLQRTPESTDFGAVKVGDTVNRDLWLINDCERELTVFTIELNNNQSEDFAIEEMNYPIILQQGEGFFLSMSFTPSLQTDLQATLSIVSDDPIYPIITHEMTGKGAGIE